MANIPTFATGKYASIQPAIDAGILTYPSYVFIIDDEEEQYNNRFAFIDKNLDIRITKADGAGSVEKVDSLPDVEDADSDTLYIYDGMVYILNGDEYEQLYQDYTDAVDALQSKVDALEEAVENITDGSSGLIFSSRDAFPEEGVGHQLYIDISEETGGIYAFDTENNVYVQLSSTTATGVPFIELDGDDDDDGDGNDGGDGDGNDGDDDGVVKVSTLSALNEAIADDDVTDIELEADIEGEGSKAIVIDNGSEKTIDLAGHTVSVPYAEDTDSVYAVYVANGSTLNIKDSEGTGTVDAGTESAYNTAVVTLGDSTANIYGGNYVSGNTTDGTNGSSTIYGYEGAINIYGGYFENQDFDNEEKDNYVLNIKNGSGAYITCYGGEFLDQNPEDGDDTDTITGGTFLANGYTVSQSDVEDHILYTVNEADQKG